MNEVTLRFRKVFFKIGKSQSEIARTLNVTPAYIWKLLNNDDAAPSERLIDDICEKFSVNKDWLKTGNGGDESMFVQEDVKYLQNLGKLASEPNEFKKFYLNMMLNLPDEYWNYIYNEFKKFEKSQEKDS